MNCLMNVLCVLILNEIRYCKLIWMRIMIYLVSKYEVDKWVIVLIERKYLLIGVFCFDLWLFIYI